MKDFKEITVELNKELQRIRPLKKGDKVKFVACSNTIKKFCVLQHLYDKCVGVETVVRCTSSGIANKDLTYISVDDAVSPFYFLPECFELIEDEAVKDKKQRNFRYCLY